MSEPVVAHRLAGHRHLAHALQPWAFGSIRRSSWGRELSDAQPAPGKGHHAAQRALGNRWLEGRWHRRHRGVLDHGTVHVANRSRALGQAAWAINRRTAARG